MNGPNLQAPNLWQERPGTVIVFGESLNLSFECVGARKPGNFCQRTVSGSSSMLSPGSAFPSRGVFGHLYSCTRQTQCACWRSDVRRLTSKTANGRTRRLSVAASRNAFLQRVISLEAFSVFTLRTIGYYAARRFQAQYQPSSICPRQWLGPAGDEYRQGKDTCFESLPAAWRVLSASG